MRHEITIILTQGDDTVDVEVTTPETLSTIEVVGVLELAKKQFVDSKHSLAGTVYHEAMETIMEATK